MKAPFGFEALRRFVEWATGLYYRAEVRGLERIPEGPCLLVGNHNGIGVMNPEIWIFGSRYLATPRRLSVLGHDLALRVPGLRAFATRYLRYVPNTAENAIAALRSGSQVLVFPGGGWESCRPSSMRDRIDFKDRSGFVRVAREAGVPIVPVVTAGAHDGVFIWSRGERVARALGLPRLIRLDTFPLGLTFPFLFQLGPFTPFVPLPSKVIIEVLAPVEVEPLAPTDALRAREVVALMQQALTRNVQELPRAQKR